jgi:hypothetical protein
MSAHLWDCIDDDYTASIDFRRACRSCGSISRHLVDGWCPRCNGEEPSPWEDERRELERARERTRQAEIRANRKAGF